MIIRDDQRRTSIAKHARARCCPAVTPPFFCLRTHLSGYNINSINRSRQDKHQTSSGGRRPHVNCRLGGRGYGLQVTPAPMSNSAAQAKESADAAEFLEILCSIGRQAGGPGETSTSSGSSGSHSGSSSRSRGSGSNSGSSGSYDDDDDDDDDEEDKEGEGVDDSKHTAGTRDTLHTHQTSATIDTVMTGDHVNALLKVHKEENINRRWSETAETMIGDMMTMRNNNEAGQYTEVVPQVDVPEDSMDGASPKPRFSIKQGVSRRASSQGSFETLDKVSEHGGVMHILGA